MKKIILLLIFPFIAIAQQKTDTIKVYFLGGQSNMQGYGYNKDLPNDLKKPFDNVYIFQGNSLEDEKPNGALGKWEKLQPGHGTEFSSDGKTNNHSDRFGVELSMAKRLQELNPKQKIAFIKYSRNGSSIDSLGAPYFGTWEIDYKSKSGQNQYDNFLKTVKNACANKDIDNNGIQEVLVPAGIVWMQGESDANSETVAAKYYSNLKRLMDSMRATFMNNDLPIVLGKISDSGQDTDGKVWDYGELVQYGQEKFIKSDKKSIIVRTTSNYQYSDKYHYDSTGYIDLGKQFAEALQKISQKKQ